MQCCFSEMVHISHNVLRFYLYVHHSRRQSSLRHFFRCFIHEPTRGKVNTYIQISCFVHVIIVDVISVLVCHFAHLPIKLKKWFWVLNLFYRRNSAHWGHFLGLVQNV